MLIAMIKLPSLLGTTLSGRPICLPDELPPTPVALIFGFEHDARHDVGAWKSFFKAQGIAYLSVPITPVDVPANALVPTMEAMKRHVPPPAWESIIMVHQGGSALLRAFDWEADPFAKVVLMEGYRVRAAHGIGAFSEKAGEGFTQTSPGPPTP